MDVIGQHAAERQEEICKKAVSIDAVGFGEVEFDCNRERYRAENWEYIACKKGTYSADGTELTEKQLESSYDPDDIDYCKCRACCGTQRSERKKRYEQRCKNREEREEQKDEDAMGRVD